MRRRSTPRPSHRRRRPPRARAINCGTRSREKRRSVPPRRLPIPWPLPVASVGCCWCWSWPVLGAVGTAWYYASHQVVDDGHLVLQGNIDVRQVNLAFKVEGRIATLEVDEGDTVTAGQTVATLDKQYFEDDLRAVMARRDSAKATLDKLEHGSRPQEIAGAEAQVVEREATLKRAEQDFKRAERLVGKGAVSREDFDAARSALQEAEARLTAAQESRDMIQIGPRQEDIAAARAQLAAEEAAVIQSERQTDRQRFDRSQRWRGVDPGARTRSHRLSRRNDLRPDAELAGLGANVRQRTRPGADRTGNESRGPHRFGTRQDLHRSDRLHFSGRRIHPQDRGNSRTAHRPGLSPARPRGQPRRRSAPGDAGHRDARRRQKD